MVYKYTVNRVLHTNNAHSHCGWICRPRRCYLKQLARLAVAPVGVVLGSWLRVAQSRGESPPAAIRSCVSLVCTAYFLWSAAIHRRFPLTKDLSSAIDSRGPTVAAAPLRAGGEAKRGRRRSDGGPQSSASTKAAMNRRTPKEGKRR